VCRAGILALFEQPIAPEVMFFPADLHEYFVEASALMLYPTHPPRYPFTDLISEVSPEATYAEADTFGADLDAALVQ
jgi:hypothetical protein